MSWGNHKYWHSACNQRTLCNYTVCQRQNMCQSIYYQYYNIQLYLESATLKKSKIRTYFWAVLFNSYFSWAVLLSYFIFEKCWTPWFLHSLCILKSFLFSLDLTPPIRVSITLLIAACLLFFHQIKRVTQMPIFNKIGNNFNSFNLNFFFSASFIFLFFYHWEFQKL